jgi:hypothetical protein
MEKGTSRRQITGHEADFIRSITTAPIGDATSDNRFVFDAEGSQEITALYESYRAQVTSLREDHRFGIITLVEFNRRGLTPEKLLRAIEKGLDAPQFRSDVIGGLDVAEFARNL